MADTSQELDFTKRTGMAEWARAQNWKNIDLVIAIGSALGAWKPVIDEVGAEVRLVVFEPREDKNVETCEKVARVRSMSEMRRCINSVMKEHMEAVIVRAPWDGMPQHLEEEAKTVWHQCVNHYWQQKCTLSKNTTRWVEILLNWLPLLRDQVPLNLAKDSLKGVPGVVVGAGPSLDRNIAQLKALQDRALICATNTPLKSLIAAGVRPQMLVTAEQKDVSVIMEDCKEAIADLVFAPGIHCHENTYKLKGYRNAPLITIEGVFAQWLVKTLETEGITSGGSVTCIAMSALHYLGCDPLILVGQDCAFTDDKMYCNGTAYDGSELERLMSDDGTVAAMKHHQSDIRKKVVESLGDSSRDDQLYGIVEVPAWDQKGTVLSSPILDGFRCFYEDFAHKFGDRKLYNCTEGGAYINYWFNVPLEFATREFKHLGRDAIRGKLVAALDAAAGPYSGKVLSALEGQLDGVNEIQDWASAAASKLTEVRELINKIRTRGYGDELLSSYSWADLERQQKKGGSVCSMLADQMNTIESSATALKPQIETAIRGLRD